MAERETRTAAVTQSRPPDRLTRAKDHASMAVVLSAASVAWFGWGHQGGEAIAWLRWGMVVAVVLLIVSVIVLVRIRAVPTLATDAHARRVYWIAVAAEVLLIVGGAVALALTGNSQYLSTWTLFIVGIHFLPFVSAFHAPLLRPTAVACALVAALALWAGLGGWAPPPTIAGAGGGLVLLVFAALLLRTATRQNRAE